MQVHNNSELWVSTPRHLTFTKAPSECDFRERETYTHEQGEQLLTKLWKWIETLNILPLSTAFSPEMNTTAQLVQNHFVQKIMNSPSSLVPILILQEHDHCVRHQYTLNDWPLLKQRFYRLFWSINWGAAGDLCFILAHYSRGWLRPVFTINTEGLICFTTSDNWKVSFL